MKGNAKSSPFFAAYPLKAVESAMKQKTGSPYLRAILTAKPQPEGKKANRAMVFPMINPYKNPYGANADAIPSARVTPVTKVPSDIELTEKKWFHNYE
jgi:hypothetical protein